MSRVSVVIDANSAGFEKGMRNVEKSLEGAKNMVMGFFALDKGVEIIKDLTHSSFELADSLVNASLKLGITIEQMQVLKAAAKESGTEMTELESALLNVADAKQKALAGDKASLAGFKALGVNGVQDLKAGNSVDLLFGKIASTVKSKNVEDIVAPLKEVIGKPFKDVLPLLNSDVDEVGRHLKELGGIMSTETAVKLKVIGDEFDTIKDLLVVGFAPTLVTIIETMLEAGSKLLHFINDTPEQKAEAKRKADEAEAQRKAGESAHIALAKSKGIDIEPTHGKTWDFFQALMGESQVLAGKAGMGLVFNGQDEKGEARIGAMLSDRDRKGEIDIRNHGNPADKYDAWLKEMTDKMAALQNRVSNPKPINNDKSTVDNMPKSPKIYSDSLTSRGNMVGASFGNVGAVATQLQVSKQHVQVSKDQLKEIEKHTLLLTQLVAKGANTAGNLMSLF